MSTNTFTKSPAARLDYEFDWSEWLTEGDTITSYTITVPTGLTQVSASNTTTGVTVILSGGELGQHFNVLCQINTAAGLTDRRQIYLNCTER